MANEEHLSRLKQGIDAWNHWRDAEPEAIPDLSEADLNQLKWRKFEQGITDWCRTRFCQLEWC